MAEPIINILTEWGKLIVDDTKKAINEAVEYESGQESDLAGSVNYKVLRTSQGFTFQLTMADYWKYVEKGRKKGVKGVPTEKIGKVWQNSHNINAAQVIQEITIKANAKRGIKSKPKRLAYDKAAKTLAFLIQRSIKKKGIKPRPFMSKAIKPERLEQLKEMLAPVMKQQFLLDIKSALQ